MSFEVGKVYHTIGGDVLSCVGIHNPTNSPPVAALLDPTSMEKSWVWYYYLDGTLAGYVANPSHHMHIKFDEQPDVKADVSKRLIKFHNRKLMLHKVVTDDCANLAASWRIWLAANDDFTLGTYLELTPEGRLLQVTVRNGEGDDIQELTMDKIK